MINYELRKPLVHHNSKNTASITKVARWGYWPLLFYFLHHSMAPHESNHIRPNKGEFDVLSAAQVLALRGSGFAASPEYAKAISRGIDMELGQVLEQVLGTDGVEKLSLEDWKVVHYLSFGIDLAKQVPPSTADAGGDEAAASPVTSVASTSCEIGTPSSPEDQLSMDRTPLSEGTGAKPANKVTRRCQHGLRHLARGVRKMP